MSMRSSHQGRPRDMGYFDAVATRDGIELQAATEMP